MGQRKTGLKFITIMVASRSLGKPSRPFIVRNDCEQVSRRACATRSTSTTLLKVVCDVTPTADEELVNVGGHSAGSLEFEFVAWSQGTLRHNFVTTEGKVNQIRSAEKLRVMFVAGMIAELEASLRATAVATRKATYGVTVARRGARAVKRLKSAAGKVNSPILHQIVRIGSSVTFQAEQSSRTGSGRRQYCDAGAPVRRCVRRARFVGNRPICSEKSSLKQSFAIPCTSIHTKVATGAPSVSLFIIARPRFLDDRLSVFFCLQACCVDHHHVVLECGGMPQGDRRYVLFHHG